MNTRLKTVSLLAGVGLLAACGGNDAPEPADNAGAADEPAAAAPAETAAAAPAVDDVTTTDGTTFAEFTADEAHGEQVFAQCQTCHVLEPGQNRTGPSLAGLIGREAGSVDGYSYTPANANSGITWTEEKLFQYLEDPDRVIPGTKMAFAGLPEAQDRVDVIAYIAANGGS